MTHHVGKLLECRYKQLSENAFGKKVSQNVNPQQIAHHLGKLVAWLMCLCQMGQLMVGYVYD